MDRAGIRAQLGEHQDLLDRFVWPNWARNGMIAVAVLLGAAVLWDSTSVEPFGGDGYDFVTTTLVVLAVAPWLIRGFVKPRWWGSSIPGDLAFLLAVSVPTGVLTTYGTPLWISSFALNSPISVQSELVGLIGLLLVAQLTSCARLWIGAIAALAMGALAWARTAWFINPPSTSVDVWVVAVFVAALAGLAARGGIITLQRLSDAREDLARNAVEAERRRLAGEVHDVVAHTLAVTMLHVTGARLAMATDPVRAVSALEDAERQGRSGMADVRSMVRLLRSPDQAGPTDQSEPSSATDSPLPDLDDLPDLITSYEQAGLSVDVDVDLTARAAVTPSMELATYRIVQESLANASRHGTGSATVSLDIGGSAVRLLITNPMSTDRAPSTTGTGLIGMSERVAALGGTVTAGAVDGTWVVDARISMGERR